jgi:hypothetical protein
MIKHYQIMFFSSLIVILEYDFNFFINYHRSGLEKAIHPAVPE